MTTEKSPKKMAVPITATTVVSSSLLSSSSSSCSNNIASSDEEEIYNSTDVIGDVDEDSNSNNSSSGGSDTDDTNIIEYDYKYLCRPTLNPWSKSKQGNSNNNNQDRFYGKDERLPMVLAAIMGLQHAFAMVGGLITPALVIFRFSISTDLSLEESMFNLMTFAFLSIH